MAGAQSLVPPAASSAVAVPGQRDAGHISVLELSTPDESACDQPAPEGSLMGQKVLGLAPRAGHRAGAPLAWSKGRTSPGMLGQGLSRAVADAAWDEAIPLPTQQTQRCHSVGPRRSTLGLPEPPGDQRRATRTKGKPINYTWSNSVWEQF